MCAFTVMQKDFNKPVTDKVFYMYTFTLAVICAEKDVGFKVNRGPGPPQTHQHVY